MGFVTALTYVLPHRLLSSLARQLAYSRHPAIKQWLIDTVVSRFGVDLAAAAEPDARAYPTFNAFFTRADLSRVTLNRFLEAEERGASGETPGGSGDIPRPSPTT